MSGWRSLLRLNMTLLLRRRLPMWIAGTALLTAALSTATAGVEDGEGFRAVASAARLLAAALIGLTAVHKMFVMSLGHSPLAANENGLF